MPAPIRPILRGPGWFSLETNIKQMILSYLKLAIGLLLLVSTISLTISSAHVAITGGKIRSTLITNMETYGTIGVLIALACVLVLGVSYYL